jgi:hypothetical protein
MSSETFLRFAKGGFESLMILSRLPALVRKVISTLGKYLERFGARKSVAEPQDRRQPIIHVTHIGKVEISYNFPILRKERRQQSSLRSAPKNLPTRIPNGKTKKKLRPRSMKSSSKL